MSVRALARVAVSATLLALAWRIAGGDALLAALAGVDVAWLAGAVALSVPMQMLSAARWWLTCRRVGLALGYGRALTWYYLASLMNMLLPGGVAGDVARVWSHGRAQQGPAGRARALGAVAIERGAGQCALLLALAAGIALNWERHPWARDVATALVLLASLALLLLALAARSRRASRVLSAALGMLARALLPAPVLALQALLSLAVVASYLGAFACAAHAVHAPLDASTALLAVPLVLSAMALPVSVGGLGVREASAAAVWPLAGLVSSDGTAAALVYGAAMLAGSAPGLLVPLLRRRAQTRCGGRGCAESGGGDARRSQS